jgi:hypothetical protein
MDESYKTTLVSKTIEELSSELQKIHDNIDMLFTVNNSLDDTDITEGGGAPADQDRYQTLLWQQKVVTEEINKRHLLEELK